jgi:hypothetical protein
MPIRKELRHLYRTPEYKATRAACRERAGDRCEQCGGGNREIGYRRKEDGKFVRLALGMDWPPEFAKNAHLVLIQCGCAHLDNNPANNAPENTAWLCRGCHLHRDAPFHRLTRAIRKDAARPILKQLAAIAEKASISCAADGRPDTPQLQSLKAYLQKEAEDSETTFEKLAEGGTSAPREKKERADAAQPSS